MKQCTGTDGGLRPTPRALPVLAAIGEKARMLALAALGTNEAVRPAGVLQRLLPRRLRAVPLDELAQVHTLSKLDLVLGHHWCSIGGLATLYAPGESSNSEPAN